MKRFGHQLLSALLLLSAAIAQQPQWRLINGTAGVQTITGIDIYTSNPDTMFALGKGVWRSVDKGETWVQINSSLGGLGAIRVDGLNPDYLYAIVKTPTSGDGVSMSTDGGKTWNSLGFTAGPLPNAFVELNPLDRKTIYVGLGRFFLRRSVNRGQTWDTLSVPNADGWMTELKIFPANDSIMYLSYHFGIYKSTDKGYSWVRTASSTGARHLALDPKNQNVVYATFGNDGFEPRGVFKTTDGGQIWKQINTGLDSLQVYNWNFPAIMINPKNPEELFLGAGSVQNKILYRSTNGGNSWFEFNNGLPDSGGVRSIAIDTLNRKIYIGVNAYNAGGIYTCDLLTGVDEIEQSYMPKEYLLFQNYPNPFNPTTTIQYQIPEDANVVIKVYNLLGSEVATLVNEYKPAGYYEVKFSAKGGSASGEDASLLPSGLYLYKISAGTFSETRKMLFMK